MFEKKKNKKSGYLLVEILISLFIFSVLVLVVSVFLKRIVLIEKAKKNNQKMYENMYFSMDKKNRDIQDFLYENESNNIFIKENKIIFKLNDIFYKIESANGKLYISDAENIGKFGSRVEIGKFREIKFEKIGSLLVITLNGEKSESIRVVRI